MNTNPAAAVFTAEQRDEIRSIAADTCRREQALFTEALRRAARAASEKIRVDIAASMRRVGP
jgi:hypothetical protein